MKTCTKCNKEKPKIEFNKDSSKSDGFYPSCKQCYSEYYLKIRSKKLNNKKKYREKNKEKISEYRKQHYELNKEKQKESASIWAKNNPINRRAAESKRRAKKNNSIENYTPEDINNLMELQKRKCVVCFTGISRKFHIDHILPIDLGGSNDKYNIQLLCPSCNLQKKNKHPIDFMNSKGMLL